ncbi:MAG: SpoIID/LytB domain-containing protein [Clostridia bacterium]|nr:SpoIID/LytB domain-containing protein [Clostridia bacterium]
MKLSNNTKRSRAERNKVFLRIGALILIVLMLGGSLYSAFYFFLFNASAAYDEYAFSSTTASTPYVTVGIVYGDDSPTAYPIRSPSGFVVGSVYANNEIRAFSPLFTLSQTTLTPAVDANVSKSLGEYNITNEYYQTKIGAYHIQLSINLDQNAILEMIPHLTTTFSVLGHYAFPAYINGILCIRLGDFASYDQTLNSLAQIQGYLDGFTVEIVSPSPTAVSLIDPATDHVVFEYDCGQNYYLGLTPIQTGGEDPNYLQTPADNLYEGVFAIKRYTTDSLDGVTVFNIVDLEGYVEGVLPYEVLNSWPREALRAFAIATRSYALANIGTHYKAYGFDMCTHHCQSYRGRIKVNDAVMEVVASTAGEVLSYDGQVVTSFYSSSNGGESISLNAAWGGGDSDVIVAQKNPWERYTEHENGVWANEVSPSVLASYLRSKGYTDLAGDIASITVGAYAAENSNYIKSLIFTDVYGNSVTINTTGKIQLALSKYINSANFVIGRGSLQYTVNEVQSITVTDRIAGMISQPTQEGDYVAADYITTDNYNIFGASAYTGIGTMTLPAQGVFQAFTASGFQTFTGEAKLFTGVPNDLESQTFTVFSDPDPETGLITAQTVHENTLITTVLKPITKTYTATSANNFIFAGKGWGHGVGLSQYGTCDLARAGAKAETILELYYPGSKIVDYKTVTY